MAYDLKTKFKRFLPGAGRDANGNPVQGKTRVVGEIVLDSSSGYAGSGGETLNPADIGLTTVDYIDIKYANAPSNKGGTDTREVSYNRGSGDFYLFDSTGAARVGVASGADTSAVILFDAFGDSAHDVELT